MRRSLRQKPQHRAMNGLVHSDHTAFMEGHEDCSLEMGGNFFTDLYQQYLKPSVNQVVANTQTQLAQAGTNLINNELAKRPELQQKSADAIGDTIKEAILKNKWYIIGAVVAIPTLFVVLNKLSQKKSAPKGA